MALVESIQLAHTPEQFTAHVALFKDLKNASFLREQLLAGNSDFEYAFIDATAIISTTHILAAVFRALNDLQANRLRSRNVHSEIVFSLSPNNNIAESFRRFGVTDSTRHLLVVKVSTPSATVSAETMQQHLSDHVQAVALQFTDANIAELTDWLVVRKAYKLNASTKGKTNGAASPPPAERRSVETAALGLMALKGS